MYMKRILYALALAGLIAPVAGARTLSADEAKANVAAALSDGLKKAPALWLCSGFGQFRDSGGLGLCRYRVRPCLHTPGHAGYA